MFNSYVSLPEGIMGCKIAIENDPFSSLIYRLKMVMLHSELFVYQRVGFLQQPPQLL